MASRNPCRKWRLVEILMLKGNASRKKEEQPSASILLIKSLINHLAWGTQLSDYGAVQCNKKKKKYNKAKYLTTNLQEQHHHLEQPHRQEGPDQYLHLNHVTPQFAHHHHHHLHAEGTHDHQRKPRDQWGFGDRHVNKRRDEVRDQHYWEHILDRASSEVRHFRSLQYRLTLGKTLP